MSIIKVTAPGLVCAILLGLLSPAFADPWTGADTVRELAFDGAATLDWAQTRWIVSHEPQFHEVNPILGRRPPIGTVDLYFLSSLALHAAVSRALPETWRQPWQYATLGIEAGFVGYNAELGIHFRF